MKLSELFDFTFFMVKVHMKTVVVYTAVIFGLFLLSVLLHGMGFFASVVLELLSLSVLLFYGKAVLKSDTVSDLKESMKNRTSFEILSENLSDAFAVYIGNVVVLVVLVILFFVTLFVFGIPITLKLIKMQQLDLSALILKSFLVFVINAVFWSWYFYVLPYVLGRVLRSDGFFDSLMTFFAIFVPSTWLKTFNWEYAKLIIFASLVSFLASLVMGIFLLSVVLSFLVPVVAYGLNVFWGCVCAESYRICSQSNN